MDAANRSRVLRLVSGNRPVLAGPFAGEIGYELLYWIPFLRGLCQEVPSLRDRLTVCSRGGVASWYADLTPRYIELFDLISAEELAERRSALHADARPALRRRLVTPVGVKQGGEVDEHLVRLASEAAGLRKPTVVPPALMYKMLRNSREPSAVYASTHEPRPITPPTTTLELPERFIAVRFYGGGGTPRRDHVAAGVARIVAALADEAAIVSVDPGIELDQHVDFPIGDVIRLPALEPATNLRELTAVISRAELFVGSYGGFSYIAPHVGVPTLAWLAQPATSMGVGEHHLAMIRRLFASPAFGDYLVMTPALAERSAAVAAVFGALASAPDPVA
jgi:hypothetical protein